MDLGQVLDFANSGIGQMIIYGVFFAGIWWVENKLNKPKALEIAYKVVGKVEDSIEEGTTLDNFMDQFIKAFEDLHGRKPSAGELKKAADIKKKVEEDIKEQ